MATDTVLEAREDTELSGWFAAPPPPRRGPRSGRRTSWRGSPNAGGPTGSGPADPVGTARRVGFRACHREPRAPYWPVLQLFAWNHADEIMAKEQGFREAGGRWIRYVPDVHVS